MLKCLLCFTLGIAFAYWITSWDIYLTTNFKTVSINSCESPDQVVECDCACPSKDAVKDLLNFTIVPSLPQLDVFQGLLK